MGLFDFGKIVESVGDAVGNAAAAAKDTAENAAKAVADTAGDAAAAVADTAGGAAAAVADTAGGAASAVADTVGGAAAAAADTVGGAATAVMDGSAMDAVTTAVKDTADNVAGAIGSVVGPKKEEVVLPVQSGLTARDALRLFYYEMSADGKVVDDELEKFKEIGAGLSGSVPESELAAIIDDCQGKLDACQSAVSPLIPVITCIDKLLYGPSALAENEEVVPPRLVVWNMLAIAYSDGECDAAERDLVNHVAQVVEVEESLVLEMESFAITLIDLDHEETWIKTTDQPYLTIEAALQDMEARKSAVLDGVMDLIAL